MMWYWNGQPHWWGWLIGVVVMVAFWTAIIWGIWFVLTSPVRRRSDRFGDAGRSGRDEGDRGPERDDAARILDERLARGEIDEEEYHRLHEALSRHRRPAEKSGTASG